MTISLADRCLDLSTPDYTNFAASLFILLGILVSYLPQHYRIISRRSSEGISPYFVLLGTTSGTCAFANVLALPISRQDLACCKVNSGFACFAGLLGILQVGVQWLCFVIILLLFLLFFPRATALAPPYNPESSPTFKTAIIIAIVCMVHAFCQAVANIVATSSYANHLQGYASAIGIIATSLAAVQYFPQIWTTWRLKTVASLSIPMMCIQTPGSYVWAGSLFARLGWAGWSTWGLYMVTGLLQGSLLVMGIIFEIRNRKNRAGGVADNGGADDGEDGETNGQGSDERTPLISNGSS